MDNCHSISTCMNACAELTSPLSILLVFVQSIPLILCQVQRPRQATEALAMTLLRVLPSANRTASAPSTMTFRGSMAGLHVSPPTLRLHPRECRRTGRGSMWIAIPYIGVDFHH